MLEIGTLLSDRYELRQPTGEGWARSVWRAYDQLLKRDVAVKFRQSNPEDTTRLENYLNTDEILYYEARLFAQLEHPQILPIYDVGTYQGDTYLVTRYLDSNDTIKSYLKNNILNIEQFLSLAQQLASLLDFFREQNIVHGDFSAHNFLLDSQLQPYVFNLVVASTQSALQEKSTQSVAGSPPYMAPETFLGEVIDYRADLYAFGIMLYQCLCNERPFKGNFPLAMGQINHRMGANIVRAGNGNMKRVEFKAQLPSVLAKRPDLPITIDLILDKLTRYDPDERYQTAIEAYQDLNEAFYANKGQVDGKVFISYARQDEEYVQRLAQELKRFDIDIWFDKEIQKGSDWSDSIESALNGCDKMLLIMTDASMQSDYVTYEWSYFMGSKKSVYPFIPQSTVPMNIHPRLERIQYVLSTDDMLMDIANIIDILSTVPLTYNN